MVLVRDDVEPDLVTQPVFVEAFLEQPRRSGGIAIAVRQAAAHRIDAVEHLLRDERIGVFAEIPGLHALFPASATHGSIRRYITEYFRKRIEIFDDSRLGVIRPLRFLLLLTINTIKCDDPFAIGTKC